MDFLDNNNEDREYRDARRERLERMKLEKQRQAAQRAMIKKMIPFVVIGIVAVALIVTAIVWGTRNLFNKPHKDLVEIDAAQVPAQSEPEEVEEEIVEEEHKNVDIQGMPEMTVALPNMINDNNLDDSQATDAISEEDVQSQFAVLCDVTNGKTLVSKNGRDRMNPASMTKVMTVLVACEHIENLDDIFEITLEDTDFAYINDLSCAGFEAGEKVPIKDVLYGAIMPSGGECCHALERYVAGDEDAFIAMMNDKAKELGLTGTHYTNSAGLYNENHYTTTIDMTIVMKAAIENDLCREILHSHIYTTASTTEHPEGLELSNWFLRRIEDKYSKTEVLGAKTGYVLQSGNCAVSYTIGTDGTVYICTTGNAHSAWRAIYDHVSLYNMYVK